MLVCDRLSMAYDNGKRKRAVLDGLPLHVSRGQFVSVIGPSGSGKSTLLHIIGGLIAPTSGAVLLDGVDISGRTGHVSYMPQHNTLFPWRTVEDNAALALEVAGTPLREARRTAREWLPRIGLGGYEKAYPHELSGGMQQRVAFLRALLGPQELMCLDEPFGALDALTRYDMQRWLLEIWEQHRRTVLFVTHSIEEALFLSDRIYVLSANPAKVVREIEVPFARPRRPALLSDPELIRLKSEIHHLLGYANGSPSHAGAVPIE